MNKQITKKALPHIAAVIIFLIISLAYLFPVLEGKQINAHDTSTGISIAREVNDYHNETGEAVLWTNILFSGMPTFLIHTRDVTSLLPYIESLVTKPLPYPINVVFLYMLGFYILLLVLRVNPWLAIAGSIAFAFSSYFFIILEAGHYTKAFAIAYMAPTLAGVILIYKRQYMAGALLTTLFAAIELRQSHIQITYYLAIIILFFVIAELITHLRNKIPLGSFIKSTGILILAGLFALLLNVNKLWMTYEYTDYSTRGKSELQAKQENETAGLDRDYATAWSYGIPETMTLLIPDFHGGSSQGSLGKNSSTYEVLRRNNIPNPENITSGLPLYWGTQPFTSGPVYAGAIVIYLFVLGLFLIKGNTRWWILGSVILALLLSWGRNLMWFTNIFLDFVPLYNKFRAVSMILVIVELCLPLLGILALQRILDKEIPKKEILKKAKLSFYIVGGALVFFILFSGSLFSYSNPEDVRYGLPEWLLEAIREDRQKMLRNDAIRSLIFIIISFGLIWLIVKEKIKRQYALIAIGVLFIADLWPVNKRYLDNNDFEPKRKVENPYTQAPADKFILEDQSLFYRVFNITEDLDKSARTSYFHFNVGGYHGAKMERYQELVEYHLQPERMKIIDVLQAQQQISGVLSIMEDLPVTNMLNTKYIIYNNEAQPLENPFAPGNAWFVKDYEIVANADAEIAALNDLNIWDKVVIDERFSDHLEGFIPAFDPDAEIELTQYTPNNLTFEYSAGADQLTILSYIYYDKG